MGRTRKQVTWNVEVDSATYKAHLAVLAKRVVRKPHPPRIQAVLKQVREYKARLAATPALTKEALAREIGINPGQFTRLL